MNEVETCPCRVCAKPTPMTGTKLCDACWEAERRVSLVPAQAATSFKWPNFEDWLGSAIAAPVSITEYARQAFAASRETLARVPASVSEVQVVAEIKRRLKGMVSNGGLYQTGHQWALEMVAIVEALHLPQGASEPKPTAEIPAVPALDRKRTLIANLASIVRAQNGNLHEDINKLLEEANQVLSEKSETSVQAPPGYVPVDEVKALCRDYSSRTGNVYIMDVLGSLDSLARQHTELFVKPNSLDEEKEHEEFKVWAKSTENENICKPKYGFTGRVMEYRYSDEARSAWLARATAAHLKS